jgi:hypothetical protein
MFRNKIKKDVPIEEVENIIGSVLQDRNRFINYGEVSQGNIYISVPIMSLFAVDKEAVAFEFDILALSCLFTVFNAHEISKDVYTKALGLVMENFGLSDESMNEMYEALIGYDGKNEKGVADHLFDRLTNEGLASNYKLESTKLLSKTVKNLINNLDNWITKWLNLV